MESVPGSDVGRSPPRDASVTSTDRWLLAGLIRAHSGRASVSLLITSLLVGDNLSRNMIGRCLAVNGVRHVSVLDASGHGGRARS